MGEMGEPDLVTKSMGERVYNDVDTQLCNIVEFFQERPRDSRMRHQAKPTRIPMPWGQSNSLEELQTWSRNTA